MQTKTEKVSGTFLWAEFDPQRLTFFRKAI